MFLASLRKHKWQTAATVAALLVALLLPALASGYWIRLFTNFFMMATMASAVNLITGYTGYPAMGNTVFFGLGAYGVGVLMTEYHFSFFPSMLVGGLVSAVYAVVIGLPVLRTKGHYFLMATLGIMEATREIINNLHITGGEKGLFLPVTDLEPAQLNNFFYFVMAGLLALTLAATWWVLRTRFGFAVRAIRASESGAAVLGINTTGYKVAAWAVSAFLTGLVGGAYAYWATFIEPKAVFDVLMAVKVFVMMLLGGPGTIIGPVVGAFMLEVVGDLIWSAFPDWQLGVLGIVLIAVILIAPRGVMEFLSVRLRRVQLGGLEGASRKEARPSGTARGA